MANKFDVHETVPYIPYFVGCASDGYAYGFNGLNLLSFNDSLALEKTGAHTFSPGLTSYNSFATKTDGLVFVVGSVDSGVTYSLYRTDDFGDTFTKVFDIGREGETQISAVWVLQKGLCAARIKGVDVLLLGEYNVNSSRTNGGANDRVRIMASYDLGLTWSKLVEWNTAGTHYLRHIHGIVQDPVTEMVYILIGDNESGGMLRWDGVTDWTDNTSIADYGDIPGFKSLPYTTGSQSVTAVDLVITDNYIHWFADNGVVARGDTGIWRANKDFSSPVRIDQSIDSYMPCDGWSGVVTSDGKILFTNVVYSSSFNGPSTDFEIKVWLSEDEGATYSIIGRIGCKVNNTTFCSMTRFSDAIIISMQGAAGKSYNCATVIKDAGDVYLEDHPICFHPVYWVSTSGDDSAYAGYAPPGWRTPKYALSSRMSYGARLIIEAGEYSTTQLTQSYSSSGFSSNPGDPDAVCVVEGRGRGNTSIFLPAEDTNTSLLYCNSSRPMLLKDIALYSKKTTAYALLVDTGSATIKTVRCKLGNVAYASYVIRVVTSYRSRGDWFESGNNDIFRLSANAAVDVAQFVMVGGTNQINYAAANTSANLFYNGVCYNYATRGLINQSGGALSGLRVRNVIFKGSGTASADLYDYQATADNYNYCLFCGTIVPAYVTGGANSIKTADPMFVSPSTGDLSLQRTSPCVNRGVAISGVTADHLGNPIIGTPDIGAYEYQEAFNAYCGPWTPFNSSMPPLALAPTAPGSLLGVQEWSKVATAQEIHKVTKYDVRR